MSTPRYCEFWKANNGKWYLDLAVNEESRSDYFEEDDWRSEGGNETDGTYEDCVTYGPFDSEDACEKYLDNFSNPGSFYVDPSGKNPPPTKSPNGSPVVSPRGGTSYGPSSLGSTRYRNVSASAIGEPSVPSKPVTTAQVPTKNYKVYGKKTIRPFTNQTTKVVPVHTRMKGKAYGPIDKTRFKKDDQIGVIVPKNTAFADDGKTPRQIAVNDPEFKGANQYWSVDNNDVKKESVLRQFIRGVLITR